MDLTEISEQDMVAVLSKRGREDWEFITFAVGEVLGWKMAAAVERSEGKGTRAVIISRKDFEEGRFRIRRPPKDFDPDETGQWILRCESGATNDVWLVKDPNDFTYVDADKPEEAHKFSSVEKARGALVSLYERDPESRRINWRWSIVEWDDELGLAPITPIELEAEACESFLHEVMEGSSDDDLDF
jgi:hypothetical protein